MEIDLRLEQTLLETVTTNRPQVVLSALDPQTLYDATTEVANTHISQSVEIITTMIQLPLFPDLVQGLCQRLWDSKAKWEGGNPFATFMEDSFETYFGAGSLDPLDEICGNIVVKRALARLVPLSKRQDEHTALLIDAYCAGNGCTPAELRELGLSRALSRQDQLDLLIVLLRQSRWPEAKAAMYQGSEPDLFLKPRLIIQIDCIQEVTHCSPLEVAQLTAALTYISDEMGDGSTLWLNVDDDDPSFPAEVRKALGPRFMTYITHDLTV